MGWFSATLLYFGLLTLTPVFLTAAHLPGSSEASSRDLVYASALATSFAEIPGLLAATAALPRMGRVATTAACLAASALCVGAIICVPLHLPALRVLLLALARMLAFGGYSALYVLTAEVFPTSLRATGFGLTSTCSRLAGILSPFVAGSVWNTSPPAALGILCAAGLVCSALLLLLVRETGRGVMADDVPHVAAHVAPHVAPHVTPQAAAHRVVSRGGGARHVNVGALSAEA